MQTLRWGHVQLVQQWTEPLVLEGPNGPYVADTHGGPKMWKLRCDCGHEFDIEKATFPGKHALRSCERPECPHSAPEVKQAGKARKKAPEPRQARESGAAHPIYLPNRVAREIQEYASRKGLSFSKATAELAHEGYQQMTTGSGNPEAGEDHDIE